MSVQLIILIQLQSLSKMMTNKSILTKLWKQRKKTSKS
jgi:hypothetical protein